MKLFYLWKNLKVFPIVLFRDTEDSINERAIIQRKDEENVIFSKSVSISSQEKLKMDLKQNYQKSKCISILDFHCKINWANW